MIGLEIIKEALPEHLEEIKKIGFDYACDVIDPKKFKYQTQEEKDAFVNGVLFASRFFIEILRSIDAK